MHPDGARLRPRVIVGVSRSASSVQALRRGAQEALSRDAVLVPVHAWLPPTLILPPGYPAIEPDVLPEEAGWAQLWDSYDAAFKETPYGGDVEPVLIYGHAGASLLRIANRSGDLLVLGTGQRNTLKKLRHAQTLRYCVARAKCEILIVPLGDAGVRERRSTRARRWA